jgi:replicative DNA helicase
MQKVTHQVAKLSNTDPDEAARLAFNEFSRIRIATMPRKYESSPDDYIQRVEEYKQRVLTKAIQGVTLGWSQVDEDLMGLREKTLTGVIGRPKQGKSWFLLKSANAAWQNSVTDDFVFNTLELSIQEMEDRHLCMVAGVSYGRFMRGTLEGSEQKSLVQAAEFIARKTNRLHFLRPDVGDRTVPYMLQQAMEMNAKALYIDQLSWIDPSKHFKDAKWREVEYTMAELKAATDPVPIYFAAQFNREASSMNEMGDLSQIGLSDSIGQTCDMLLGIYASKDMRANKIVEFGVIEARAFERVRYDMHFKLDGANYIQFMNRKVD